MCKETKTRSSLCENVTQVLKQFQCLLGSDKGRPSKEVSDSMIIWRLEISRDILGAVIQSFLGAERVVGSGFSVGPGIAGNVSNDDGATVGRAGQRLNINH